MDGEQGSCRPWAVDGIIGANYFNEQLGPAALCKVASSPENNQLIYPDSEPVLHARDAVHTGLPLVLLMHLPLSEDFHHIVVEREKETMLAAVIHGDVGRMC